jgi:hypothetical protein
MKDYIEIMSGRAMSAFPLSIGTSLAFESLFAGRQSPYDPDREIPKHINIFEYQTFLINVGTLIRNIVSSVPTEEMYSLNYRAVLMALQGEIDTIIDIMNNEGQNRVELYFYVRDYKFTHKLSSSPLVMFKAPNTEKQKILENIYYRSERGTRSIDSAPFIHHVSRDLIHKSHKKALILTSMPYDLLSFNIFSSLDLLESYTGVVKTRKEFYTKLHEGKKLGLENIPYIRRMLAIFGDSHLYKPMPMNIRKIVLDLAATMRWTPVTTEERVKNDIYYHQADLGLKKEYLKF